jgi:hypothetical protein
MRLSRSASLIVALLAATPAPAQRPASDAPCAEADSAHIAEVAARNHHGLQVMLMAPGILLAEPLLWCDAPRTPLRFAERTVAVRASAGLGYAGDRAFLVRSASMEAAHGRAYLELRGEQYDLPDDPELWTLRGGYLFRPAPSLAGGILLGFRSGRHSPGGWARYGVELGFPIMATMCRPARSCWIRWEPVYLVTSEGADFSPRLESEFPLGRTPVIAGVSLELKGVRGDDPLIASVSLGIRP